MSSMTLRPASARCWAAKIEVVASTTTPRRGGLPVSASHHRSNAGLYEVIAPERSVTQMGSGTRSRSASDTRDGVMAGGMDQIHDPCRAGRDRKPCVMRGCNLRLRSMTRRIATLTLLLLASTPLLADSDELDITKQVVAEAARNQKLGKA